MQVVASTRFAFTQLYHTLQTQVEEFLRMANPTPNVQCLADFAKKINPVANFFGCRD